MRKALKLIFFTVWAFGCSDENQMIPNPSQDQNFFPISPNRVLIYSVTVINYEITGFDTLSYFVREVLTDSISTTPETSYIYNQLVSLDSGLSWEVDDVFTIRQTSVEQIYTRDNLPLTQLVFPVQEGKNWDRNNYNTQAQQLVRYGSGENVLKGDYLWLGDSDLVEVIINDIPANLVNQDERYEYYARNVGLIEKESIVLNFCTVDCDSAGQIETGQYFYKTLVSFDE